jgi:signal transduction histidine kinase
MVTDEGAHRLPGVAMDRKETQSRAGRGAGTVRLRDYYALSQRILRSANREISHIDFLRELTHMLLDFAECDAIELCVLREHQYFRCKAIRGGALPANIEVTSYAISKTNGSPAAAKQANPMECLRESEDSHGHASLVRIPLIVAEEQIGLLLMKSREKDFFPPSVVGNYKNIAQTLGLILVNQYVDASLRERVKELTCLYCMAQLADQPNILLGGLLQGVVKLLPSAWQYPEIAVARILLDDGCYATAGFRECAENQRVNLVIKQQVRGSIEVGYTRRMPELDEGPFLKEERSLIETVASQLSLLVERREAAEEKIRLQVQLRHADRLATIGQLSAGVAHELNEPLGNILAFAQLARKEPNLLPQTAADLDKIVATSLHAREIIKKLMLFARQMPPQKLPVNLNKVVADGLFFLESRCSKNGVTIERRLLEPGLPDIVADASQLHQVLVNLVVNAIQAMPDGGIVTISTDASKDHVVLRVEDNGIGMSPKVLKRIFVPFFTTKDVNEGTGLGLPVVHGIVTSHGGTIDVESTPGHGTRFEIRLPLPAAKSNQGTP